VDLIPDTWTDAKGNPRTNLRFQGWVAEWEADWDGEEPVIRLNCVDNTHLLIQMPAPAKGVVDKNLPLDQAIAKYLTFAPSFQGLSVEYRPTGVKAPILKQVMAKSAFRPGLGPPLARGGGAGEKLAVWDYLTDICRSVGHSVFVDGTTVVIQRVRTMTSANVQGRGDDPYVLQGGRPGMPVRRMIYGRNVKRMTAKRNFTKNAPVNVSVRAYNPEQKQVIVERFPLEKDKQVYALPGDSSPDQKWAEITVGGGVTDRPTLRAFAQEYYEQLSRQEIGWTVETENFASFGGGNEDPDLLDLRFADSLEILVTREDEYAGSASLLEQQLTIAGANSLRLQNAGFDERFADAYAKAYTDAGFQTIYRVHKVEVSGSTADDEGVSFRIDCVNYVELTSDKSLAPGEEPAATTPASPPALPKLPPPPPGPAPGGG
jgi:hypothetical protein